MRLAFCRYNALAPFGLQSTVFLWLAHSLLHGDEAIGHRIVRTNREKKFTAIKVGEHIHILVQLVYIHVTVPSEGVTRTHAPLNCERS